MAHFLKKIEGWNLRSCGYDRRLTIKRSRVRISSLDESFFTFIYSKNVLLFVLAENTWKRGREWPIFKNTHGARKIGNPIVAIGRYFMQKQFYNIDPFPVHTKTQSLFSFFLSLRFEKKEEPLLSLFLSLEFNLSFSIFGVYKRRKNVDQESLNSKSNFYCIIIIIVVSCEQPTVDRLLFTWKIWRLSGNKKVNFFLSF